MKGNDSKSVISVMEVNKYASIVINHNLVIQNIVIYGLLIAGILLMAEQGDLVYELLKAVVVGWLVHILDIKPQ
jgi:hypothetical protein